MAVPRRKPHPNTKHLGLSEGSAAHSLSSVVSPLCCLRATRSVPVVIGGIAAPGPSLVEPGERPLSIRSRSRSRCRCRSAGVSGRGPASSSRMRSHAKVRR
jgi:hypothetical protein